MKKLITCLFILSLSPMSAFSEEQPYVQGNAAFASNASGATSNITNEDEDRTSGSNTVSQVQVGLANAQTVKPLSAANVNVAIAVNEGSVIIKSKNKSKTTGGTFQHQVGLANAQTAQ